MTLKILCVWIAPNSFSIFSENFSIFVNLELIIAFVYFLVTNSNLISLLLTDSSLSSVTLWGIFG